MRVNLYDVVVAGLANLLAAAAWWPVGSWVSVGLIALFSTHLVAALAVVVSVLRGRGDQWLVGGARASLPLLRLANGAALLNNYVALASAPFSVAACFFRHEDLLLRVAIPAVASIVLCALQITVRRVNATSLAAIADLRSARFSRAAARTAALIELPVLPPSMRAIAQNIALQAQLGLGDRVAARQIADSLWSGAVDETAAPRALMLLGDGQTAPARDLADRWHPTNPLDLETKRWLVGALQLWSEPRAVPLADLQAQHEHVPRESAGQIALLLAATYQRLGDQPAAAAWLARVAPQTRAIRVGMLPWLEPLLADITTNRVSGPLVALQPVAPRASSAAPTTPFAAPRDDGAAAPTPRYLSGAVPTEWIALGAGVGFGPRGAGAWTMPLLRRGIIVLLGLPAGVASLVAGLLDDDPTFVALGGAVLAMVSVQVLSLVVPLLGVLWTTSDQRPSIVIATGRRVPTARLWPWSWWLIISAVGPSLVLYAALIVLFSGPARWLFMPLALLSMIISINTVANVRLTVAAQIGDRAAWRAALWLARPNVNRPGQLASAALCDLWSGDLAAARATLHQGRRNFPPLNTLNRWFDAADGTADLRWLLDLPIPDADGEQYRLAVAIGLAALATHQTAGLGQRIDAWERQAAGMGGRFGDLLALVAGACRLARSEPVHARLSSINRADFVDLVAVWPILTPALDATRT